ncbi:prolyl 3-hydroxylase OGFOD1-like [Ciona intestinalis]
MASGKLLKLPQNVYKPQLNNVMQDEKVKKNIESVFQRKNENKDSGTPDNIDCSSFPFPHCVIKDFLCLSSNNEAATEFVNQLRQQLLKLNFSPKSNDLYKFSQTSELIGKPEDTGETPNRDSNLLPHFTSLLRKKLLPWLHEVTSLELNDDIDMFCAQYSDTDYLLCHDDELEFRRVAYVYYLTPDWSMEEGGALQLFDSKQCENNGTTIYDPTSVVRSIVPTFNSMVLFEVCPTSFHQVQEIVTSSKTRLSLTGWFHGPTEPRPPRVTDAMPPMNHYLPSNENTPLFPEWLDPSYLNIGTQATIQEQFTEDSEIQLNNFLLQEKYDALCDAVKLLRSRKELWEICGPPSKQCYHKLKISMEDQPTVTNEDPSMTSSMTIVRDIIQLFHSEEMFLFLSNVTGLSFHPMTIDSDDEEETNGKRQKLDEGLEPGTYSTCRFEVRRWEKGSYRLLRDNDYERGEFSLDVNLFLNVGDWCEDNGGCLSYIADNEDEELLTIVPSSNNLSVAYRDSGAIRFVKYINHLAPHEIYDVSMSYVQ